MRDCRDCNHNGYLDIKVNRVWCSHPVTLVKSPRWQEGDPAWVSMQTRDVPISRLSEMRDCPTYELATAKAVA